MPTCNDVMRTFTCAFLQGSMTHVLAAPDFARGRGFFADVQEVAWSVWAVGRRLYPCFATSEDLHEVHSWSSKALLHVGST